jgi:hypothetical protein
MDAVIKEDDILQERVTSTELVEPIRERQGVDER